MYFEIESSHCFLLTLISKIKILKNQNPNNDQICFQPKAQSLVDEIIIDSLASRWNQDVIHHSVVCVCSKPLYIQLFGKTGLAPLSQNRSTSWMLSIRRVALSIELGNWQRQQYFPTMRNKCPESGSCHTAVSRRSRCRIYTADVRRASEA